MNQLGIAENVGLATATLIAAIVLFGWLVPAVGSMLPDGWSLMKANTATGVLLCVASFALAKPRPNTFLHIASMGCAGIVLILGGATLFEYWSGHTLGLDTLMAADSGAGQMPGRMSMQSATFFVFLGLSLMINRTRQGLRGYMLDALCAGLVMYSLVLIAGYIFGATKLVDQSSPILTSPQTLVCIGALTFVATCRRAPYGFYSVLVGVGIGSNIARTVLPFSLILPYLTRGTEELLIKLWSFAPQNVAALTASSMSALLFLLVVLMARKINALERELRDMSLSDELTGIHNRRGFYMLGEQVMRNALRDARSVTVLFLDVDGLKEVNDTLGHDVGSQLLLDVATLLRANFRSSEVIGRLGGDEFAVIAPMGHDELMPALRRLDNATEAANATGNKPYQISFSKGSATTKPKADESVTNLVDLADAAMYEDKKHRHAIHSAP